jgi:hypothetical protein
MLRKLSKLGALSLCLLLSPSFAQVGHPAKGSWIGYWGPNAEVQHRVVLNLDWRNRAVVGEINPGAAAAAITKSDIDYATWIMTLEARLPGKDGKLQPWVAKGKLENLGSWTNRVYSGTYTHGSEQGSFKVRLH